MEMEMCRTASSSHTETEIVSPNTSATSPILRLRLQKKKSEKTVGWSNGTVDNEHMNRKKSKCCCIYKKPLAFGESSSEEEDECEHCFGHPEKRKRTLKCPEHGHSGNMHQFDETRETSIPDQSEANLCTTDICNVREDVPCETNPNKSEQKHAED